MAHLHLAFFQVKDARVLESLRSMPLLKFARCSEAIPCSNPQHRDTAASQSMSAITSAASCPDVDQLSKSGIDLEYNTCQPQRGSQLIWTQEQGTLSIREGPLHLSKPVLEAYSSRQRVSTRIALYSSGAHDQRQWCREYEQQLLPCDELFDLRLTIKPSLSTAAQLS